MKIYRHINLIDGSDAGYFSTEGKSSAHWHHKVYAGNIRGNCLYIGDKPVELRVEVELDPEIS